MTKLFVNFGVFVRNKVATPPHMSLEEAASWLLRMAKTWPHEARNAYSGLLLIPGWEHLKFNPLIKACKKFWDQTGDRYSGFWDARKLPERLQEEELDWNSLWQVRDRCIICLRLLHLCRSVDLARCWRRKAVLEGQPYLWIRRKGQRRPRFERLVTLPFFPALSPAHLVDRYVAMTAPFVAPGSSMFLALKSPYKALTSNTIGNITKMCLKRLGVPVSVFGAHSTRGAAVGLYKSLGLSSEIVCELGGWKNAQAFTNHYLRLGAAEKAAVVLSHTLVHKDPSCEGAKRERSCSPGRTPDPGRNDLASGAPKQDGPTPHPVGARKKEKRKRWHRGRTAPQRTSASPSRLLPSLNQ